MNKLDLNAIIVCSALPFYIGDAMPAKTKKARREAALKAWDTRRKNEAKRKRKAKKAALKAWETRHKNETVGRCCYE